MRNQANKMVLLAPMDIYIWFYNCWGRAQLNVSKNIIIHLVQLSIFEVHQRTILAIFFLSAHFILVYSDDNSPYLHLTGQY